MKPLVQAVGEVDALSCQVDAPRGLLLGAPAHLGAGFAVLAVAAAPGITAASALLGGPAR